MGRLANIESFARQLGDGNIMVASDGKDLIYGNDSKSNYEENYSSNGVIRDIMVKGASIKEREAYEKAVSQQNGGKEI